MNKSFFEVFDDVERRHCSIGVGGPIRRNDHDTDPNMISSLVYRRVRLAGGSTTSDFDRGLRILNRHDHSFIENIDDQRAQRPEKQSKYINFLKVCYLLVVIASAHRELCLIVYSISRLGLS